MGCWTARDGPAYDGHLMARGDYVTVGWDPETGTGTGGKAVGGGKYRYTVYPSKGEAVSLGTVTARSHEEATEKARRRFETKKATKKAPKKTKVAKKKPATKKRKATKKKKVTKKKKSVRSSAEELMRKLIKRKYGR